MKRIYFAVSVCLFSVCLNAAATENDGSEACLRVEGKGFGKAGETPLEAESVVEGLEVPWGIGFLPGGDLLVTERPGRLRLVREGKLVKTPVASLETAKTAEGGLLGVAVDPDFASNRFVYLYVTARGKTGNENRIERWRLDADHAKATRERTLVSGIPAADFHDGGRLRFGPDGLLYASTGDARSPARSSDVGSLAGKILRLTRDGRVPVDNPHPSSLVYISGVRNSQGFDWRDDGALYVVDHGPSGEFGRRGGDEVNVARAGDDLGWPTLFRCEKKAGHVTPSLVFETAAPPGGAAVYRGTKLPEWKGALVVATLGSRHLQVIWFKHNASIVSRHEVYFQGEPPSGLGRLREAVMGPDGELYLTTSNCDGRGICPKGKDKVVRIRRKADKSPSPVP